jgi:hypothetical protein
MTDCSICYEAISAATGKMELACAHGFHISCLTKWFARQQADAIPESCPCCRHETTLYEKMPGVMEEEEEEEEEDDYDEDDDGMSDRTMVNVPDVMSEARLRACQKFYSISQVLTEDQFKNYAANRIIAGVRGYFARQLVGWYKDSLEDRKHAEDKLKMLVAEAKVFKKSFGVTRNAWKAGLATMIQAAWRGHNYRKKALAEKNKTFDDAVKGLTLLSEVNWRCAQNPGKPRERLIVTWQRIDEERWERIVLNPEERDTEIYTKSSASTIPLTLAQEMALAITKIQATWRGFRLRKNSKEALSMFTLCQSQQRHMSSTNAEVLYDHVDRTTWRRYYGDLRTDQTYMVETD